jgi:hypothetical protein
MSAPHDPRNAEAEIFRSFGLASGPTATASGADMAELDRRFENGAIDRAIAELFVTRLIAAAISRS